MHVLAIPECLRVLTTRKANVGGLQCEVFFIIQTTEKQQAFVKELHLLKTNIFMEMVEAGSMPLRAGVRRLVGEYSFAS